MENKNQSSDTISEWIDGIMKEKLSQQYLDKMCKYAIKKRWNIIKLFKYIYRRYLIANKHKMYKYDWKNVFVKIPDFVFYIYIINNAKKVYLKTLSNNK